MGKSGPGGYVSSDVSDSSASPHSALYTTAGWLVANIMLAVLASIIGVHRHAAWLLAPSVAAVVLGAGVLARVLGWYRSVGPTGSAEFAAWWKGRGVWLLAASSLPVWAALAIANSLHPH